MQNTNTKRYGIQIKNTRNNTKYLYKKYKYKDIQNKDKSK